MQTVTKLLQNNMKTIMNSLKFMEKECKEIYDVYWKTDVNTQIGALVNGTDPATVNTHLTKTEYLGGITYCEDLNDFFQNGAVTTTDYKQSIYRIQYGSAAVLADELSPATEATGTRIYDLCLNVLEIYKQGKDIINLYYDNEVGDMITSIDSQRIVPGSEMTKDDLASAITLIEEFIGMLDNEAVTQSLYSSTVSKWERLDTIE